MYAFQFISFQLPQDQPTIAELKRAIVALARIQLKRELRERHEERQRRRGQNEPQPATTHDGWGDDKTSANHIGKENSQEQDFTRKTTCEVSAGTGFSKNVPATGELVCSAKHNGHQHRPSGPSRRYLWRAYALYNPATRSLVNDENGRTLLRECGIENAQTLKFTKREKYLGKKRQ